MSNSNEPAMCCLQPPPVLRTLPGFGDGIPGLGPPPKPPWLKYKLECNHSDGPVLSNELIAVVCLSVLLALSLLSIAICWYHMVKGKRRRVNPEDPKQSQSFFSSARLKAKAKLLSEKGSSSSSKHAATQEEEESPVPSRSPSLQRQDSSTSGISTGCDNDEAGERTALRKKRPLLVQTTTRHFDAAHLPILGPINSGSNRGRYDREPTGRSGSRDTLPDVDVSRYIIGEGTLEKECANRNRESLRAPKEFPVLGIAAKQRIILEPLELEEPTKDKKSVVKKRRKVKKRRQPGRMAKGLEDDDQDEDELDTQKVAFNDSKEETVKESYA